MPRVDVVTTANKTIILRKAVTPKPHGQSPVSNPRDHIDGISQDKAHSSQPPREDDVGNEIHGTEDEEERAVTTDLVEMGYCM